MRLLFAEIRKLTQHLVGRVEVDRAGLVGILEFHSRKQDVTVYLILRVKKMRVRGRNDRLSELFAYRNDAAVIIAQRLFVRHAPLINHEVVVAYRLYLKIIVV